MTETPTRTRDPRQGWLAHLADARDESGYLEPLGARHWANFVDEGPVLLVSFDTLDSFLQRPVGDLPPHHAQALAAGWSHLSVIAEGPTWYRDPRVWRYIDRLIDEAFFEDFDRVVFYGAGMGGYAACAFSVAAPGSSVLAIRPLATLAPAIAAWDRRHRAARALDFRSRFGFAPDMVAGQQRVTVLYDPLIAEDAMHAALFRDPIVQRLTCPHLGAAPETDLAAMGLLDPLLAAAMAGDITPAAWSRLWRARRDHLPWLERLIDRAAAPRRRGLALRAAVQRLPQANGLRALLAQTEQSLAAAGLTLPPPRG